MGMMGHNDNRGWACSLGAMLSGGCRPPASKSCQPDRNFCPADRNFGNCDCFFSLPAVSRGWHSACRGRVSALLACTDVSRCQGYVLSARLEIEKVNETFDLDLPESDDYVTIGGLILNAYQSFPKLNEVINIGGFQFRIIKMSATKIELVRLKVTE